MIIENTAAARDYQRCTQCVLDTVGPHPMSFDSSGVCNYCRDYEQSMSSWHLTDEEKAVRLASVVAEIKEAGRGRRYDCIMGLSGGVDSTYIAYLAKLHGLRPLIVHLDNSWNSELAIKNIEKVIEKTGFDYYNHVVDWEEFRDLQLAYLKASVIDIEVVTDHAIFAMLHILAHRLGIRHILFGDNPRSERMMPAGWGAGKNDLANLLAIHRRFGTKNLKTYPLMGRYDQVWYRRFCGIRYVTLLHYVDNRVGVIKEAVQAEFDWREYRWKHCESVFTEFYQGYILPKKFQVDKRKAHLSSLVLAGELTREDALERLDEPYFPGDRLSEAYDFVTRKLGLTPDQFESLMAQAPVGHDSFPSDTVDLKWYVKYKFWRCWYLLSDAFCSLLRFVLGKSVCDRMETAILRRRESDLSSAFSR